MVKRQYLQQQTARRNRRQTAQVFRRLWDKSTSTSSAKQRSAAMAEQKMKVYTVARRHPSAKRGRETEMPPRLKTNQRKETDDTTDSAPFRRT